MEQSVAASASEAELLAAMKLDGGLDDEAARGARGSRSHLRGSSSMGSFGTDARPATSASILTSSASRGSLATKSMCGSQVLSHKSSAPSFSFGSGPARIQIVGARGRRGVAELLTSVPTGGQASPGPIYHPVPSKKWLGDAPHASFGTQQQRPMTGGAAAELSKLTGKSKLPGPGTYRAPSSLGAQALGRSRSFPASAFGTAKQRENAAKLTPSPGPVYDPRGTKHGSMDRAAYSFGNEIRTKNADPARTPGPGGYNSKSSFGLQAYSQMRSGRIAGFGVPPYGGGGRAVLPLEGRASPGPIYGGPYACKKQALSTRRSAPNAMFTRSDRFKRPSVLQMETPGPGEYVV